MITVVNDLASMNIRRQLGVNTGKDKKNVERLSSGYRINRAADDAAGLTISEKMRQQIRSLNQGTENAEDGVSWVQIGDGALDEVHDMLHRMTELSLQSLNETYTDLDRAAMEAEFNELQSHIDNISQNTQFNTKNIFAEHEPTFYRVEGNISWPHDEIHNVYSPQNELVITYREKEDDPPKAVTLTVPEGMYTTQELADEIEDAVERSPLSEKPRLNFEYSLNGTFNANLEGGVSIDSIDGGLSSLLNRTYQGGSTGALIGTTIFTSDSAKLPITSGKNDRMTFDIEDFSGTKTTKTLTLPAGSYNRSQIIDLINDRLSGSGVSATKYGTGIMLSGDDCIISRFKGNMFQIDGANYTSVFYDNVYHGEVSLTPGTFTGGAVLPSESYSNNRDREHSFFDIKAGVNNELTFSPDGSDSPVTITIPEGRYEISQMVSRLNSLFGSNALGLTATSFASGDFSGIKITSNLRGATSDVGLDTSSSAYNTLFVERKYNTYENLTSISNVTTPDHTATYTAGKRFGQYNNLPLTIRPGENDTFSLNINGSSYNITIGSGTYASVSAVATAVNSAISSADLGPYTGKISATYDANSRIVLTANISEKISTLNASQVSGNKGYGDIFTTSYSYSNRVIGGSNVTLDRTFPDPTSISESEKNIRVESTDGSLSYNITLPVGDSVTHDQIIQAVGQSTGRSNFKDNVFSVSTVNGQDKNFSQTANGRTIPSTTVYSSTGVTVGSAVEGQVGIVYTTNNPATVTIPLKSSFTVNSGSNMMKIALNGQTQTFYFDSGNYTPSSFAQALQQKIDNAYGTHFGGAKVEVSGNGIKITSRLFDEGGNEMAGKDTSVSVRSGDSTLLSTLNATKEAASLTTPTGALLRGSGINVSAGDTFEFTLNGVKQTVNLTALNNASGASFAAMLNNCMMAQNIPVTANAVAYGSNYRLVLTTKNAGGENSISYSSASGGTVSNALYGELRTSGYARMGTYPVKESITIEDGADSFRYTVDGVTKTATLDAGTYNRTQFLEMLNDKLEGVTASYYSGNYLQLTSDTKGSSSAVAVSYDSAAASAMRAIWGRTESKVPALEASFDATDHLILRSKDGTQFRISSSGSSFVEQNVTTYTNGASAVNGSYSTVHAKMDGRDLDISASNPLVIDEWSDTLKFNYFKDGSRIPVEINVTRKSYSSYDELQSELQSKLDSAVGAGELEVSVDRHGVVIQAVKAGSTRGIGSSASTSLSATPPVYGDFYDKVMNRTTEHTSNQSTSKKEGSNVAGTDKIPYVIGRRNVKDDPVRIREDINDTLMLDFAYTDSNGMPKSHTFTMKLDDGTYKGNDLAAMIQEKLNEKLRGVGLADNLIEVGIGGTNANVAGVQKDKVLTFKLSNSLPLPSSGEYTIDGIGGNAAFSVFYQTTGELVPAYIEGVRDITKGVVIEEGKNELSFSTDGRDYTIEIPPGEYSGSEFVSKLNSLLSEKGAPVKAEPTDEGHLKISHKQMGNHPITGLSGTARGSVFFNEYGAQDEDGSINIQYSSVLEDHKKIERPPMSTSFLGINTVTISKVKYAKKAVGRIQGALDRVSAVRSYFGATQNAIEHVINRNNNTAENTQAAESLIRDTDMAKTMFDHSTQSILMQAGMSMLSQANNSRQSVLRLLQ